MRRIEEAARELQRRVATRLDLPEVDEWRAWGEVCRQIGLVLRDARGAVEVARLHEGTMRAFTAHAVRLCNVRTRRVLSGSVFLAVQKIARTALAGADLELVDANADAWRSDRLPHEKALGGELVSDAAAVRSRRRRAALWLIVAIVGAGASLIALPQVSPWAGLVALVFWIWLLTRRARRIRQIVELAVVADGLVLQTRYGRFVAQPRDVAALTATGRGEIAIVLSRRPRWLRRQLWAYAVDAAAAAAGVATYVERHGVPGSSAAAAKRGEATA
jgi:hypothetical protein